MENSSHIIEYNIQMLIKWQVDLLAPPIEKKATSLNIKNPSALNNRR